MLLISQEDFGPAWMILLSELKKNSPISSPRGIEVRERLNVVLQVRNSLRTVLVHPQRKLNYRFMVAEWLWIWYGSDSLETIAQYNPHLRKFSDDGISLAGAYGPRVTPQWNQARNTLVADHDSRQAVIVIYTPNPPPSKDIPCTVSLQFLIRNHELHLIVTMRSSDVWLGLPYDMFVFSRLQAQMTHELRVHPDGRLIGLQEGTITFHLGSSHLYSTDFARAANVLDNEDKSESVRSPRITSIPPLVMYHILSFKKFDNYQDVPDRIWRTYAEALVAPTSAAALARLRSLTDG